MKHLLQPRLALAILSCLIVSVSRADDPGKWQSLFDGETLSGWDGDPKFWSIRDGAITGITTPENPTKGNTFVIYVGDSSEKKPVEFGNFELKLEFRIEGHNSGIQYRSFKLPGDNDGWRIGGYQADFDAKNQWAGTNYGEKFRGILAKRGEKVTITGSKEQVNKKNGSKRLTPIRKVDSLGDPAELATKIRSAPEWNEYHISAQGYHFVQKINGVTMSEVTDDDTENRRDSGLLAFQLHGGPPMTGQLRVNPVIPAAAPGD